MSTQEISNISRTEHGDKLCDEVYFNYIKCKQLLKIMKLDGTS
jgi:hypothetical protein